MKTLRIALMAVTLLSPTAALAVGPRYTAPAPAPVVLLNAAPEAV